MEGDEANSGQPHQAGSGAGLMLMPSLQQNTMSSCTDRAQGQPSGLKEGLQGLVLWLQTLECWALERGILEIEENGSPCSGSLRPQERPGDLGAWDLFQLGSADSNC